MLRHYLRFALRGLARQKLHACLAIAVLTLGLTCFLGAAVFVLYIDSYDAQFHGSDRLQVVYQRADRNASGRSSRVAERSDAQLKEQIELVAPELASVARLSLPGGTVAVDGGEPRVRNVGFADPAWADLFELEAVAGDTPAAVLAQPRGAIVTEDMARQLFGDEPAVGKTLRITEFFGSEEVTVGAVVKAIRAPSHLAADGVAGPSGAEIVASWGAFEAIAASVLGTDWGRLRLATTYALLPADGSLTRDELNRRLQLLGERLSADPATGAQLSFEARDVSSLIKDRVQNQLRGQGADLPASFTTILLAFAGLVLGVACLNFVNLATARSVSRAREIGVRKALGAGAQEVLRQDFVETAVAVALSIVLALAIVLLAGRLVADRWQAPLALPWTRPEFWSLLGALLIVVTALAGAYPAAVLARIRALTALRLGVARAGPKALRTVLVGVQCAAATFLVFAVLVFHLQTDALRRAVLDRFDDPYVVLPQTWRFSGSGQAGSGINVLEFDTLAAELRRGTGVVGVAGTNSLPFQRTNNNGQRMSRSPDAAAASASAVGVAWVTAGYRDVLDLPLLAGRWFADDRADEPTPGADAGPRRVVLDARAVRALGFASPEAAVGEIVYADPWAGFAGGPDPPGRRPAEVIGVVGGSPLALRSTGVDDGFAYWVVPISATYTLVRLDRRRVAEALEHVESVRKALAPNAPSASPQFLDQAFATAYATFDRVSRVVTILAAFATSIAAVGLFGMASFLADRRTREIGLRKTQGATTRSILRLLLTDFSKPVLIANVAIWPLAYVAARAYVNLFVERMPITPLPFLATLAATLLLAWLVIGARVVRAARVSPTVALRHE